MESATVGLMTKSPQAGRFSLQQPFSCEGGSMPTSEPQALIQPQGGSEVRNGQEVLNLSVFLSWFSYFPKYLLDKGSSNGPRRAVHVEGLPWCPGRPGSGSSNGPRRAVHIEGGLCPPGLIAPGVDDRVCYRLASGQEQTGRRHCWPQRISLRPAVFHRLDRVVPACLWAASTRHRA